MRKRTQAKQRSEREGGAASRASIEDSHQVVEHIRRSSSTRHPAGVASGAAPNLTPVTEQGQGAVPGHVASPPMSQGASPGTTPPHNQRHFPNQHRYTLVDPGSGSAGGSPPPSRTDSPSYARPAGRPPGQRGGSMPSPAMPPDADSPPGPGLGVSSPSQRSKGPTTFAEMGIQGVRLEEKECVIM